MNTPSEIKFAFNAVAPNAITVGRKQCMLKMNTAIEQMALETLDLVPSCADRTHAVRTLLTFKFWVNQALSHQVEGVEKPAQATPGSLVPNATEEKLTKYIEAAFTELDILKAQFKALQEQVQP